MEKKRKTRVGNNTGLNYSGPGGGSLPSPGHSSGGWEASLEEKARLATQRTDAAIEYARGHIPVNGWSPQAKARARKAIEASKERVAGYKAFQATIQQQQQK